MSIYIDPAFRLPKNIDLITHLNTTVRSAIERHIGAAVWSDYHRQIAELQLRSILVQAGFPVACDVEDGLDRIGRQVKEDWASRTNVRLNIFTSEPDYVYLTVDAKDYSFLPFILEQLPYERYDFTDAVPSFPEDDDYQDYCERKAVWGRLLDPVGEAYVGPKYHALCVEIYPEKEPLPSVKMRKQGMSEASFPPSVLIEEMELEVDIPEEVIGILDQHWPDILAGDVTACLSKVAEVSPGFSAGQRL